MRLGPLARRMVSIGVALPLLGFAVVALADVTPKVAASAAGTAQALAVSQQQVVDLSNQLHTLEAKAATSQQTLQMQDQQIQQLKAALRALNTPLASRSH